MQNLLEFDNENNNTVKIIKLILVKNTIHIIPKLLKKYCYKLCCKNNNASIKNIKNINLIALNIKTLYKIIMLTIGEKETCFINLNGGKSLFMAGRQ